MLTKQEIEMSGINEIYKVHESNWAAFKEKVEKLNRKIRKLGLDFEHFEILADPVGYEFIEDENKPGSGYKIYDILVAGEIIKVDGYEFIARLRHDKGAGVMIDTQPGKECPIEYRLADNHNCDHCKTRRYRKDTFVLRNAETGEFMQVGRSCLRDFYGHDIDKIAKLAEFWFECCRAATSDDNSPTNPNSLHLVSYLAYVVREIAEHGWLSRGACYGNDNMISTADSALTRMSDAMGWSSHYGYNAVAQEGGATTKEKEEAMEVIAYWDNFENSVESLNDFEYNLSILAKSAYISFKDTGRAAAMVMSYQKAMDKLKTAELRKRCAAASVHVGAVGDVLENKEFTVEMRRMVDGAWGSSPMTKMRDADGNTFTVFGGKWTTEIEAGQVVTIRRARIKKHDEFRGEKQTVLTHLKQLETE